MCIYEKDNLFGLTNAFIGIGTFLFDSRRETKQSDTGCGFISLFDDDVGDDFDCKNVYVGFLMDKSVSFKTEFH